MQEIIENPVMRLTFDLTEAGRWDSSSKTTTTHHNYQWNREQWRQIERAAFLMIRESMDGDAPWDTWNECIPPEAIEYFNGVSQDLFTEDELLDATSTAIGVVDAILGQFEEEAAKRDG